MRNYLKSRIKNYFNLLSYLKLTRMKKLFSFWLILMALLGRAHAKPVDEATARRVGQAFLAA